MTEEAPSQLPNPNHFLCE